MTDINEEQCTAQGLRDSTVTGQFLPNWPEATASSTLNQRLLVEAGRLFLKRIWK